MKADYDMVVECARLQRLPVVNFAAGGMATPADAALMMQLGADGVFVGFGIFKSEEPEDMASAIVQAVHNFDNLQILARASKGHGGSNVGPGRHYDSPGGSLTNEGLVSAKNRYQLANFISLAD